jgi:hypothetical protein
MVTRRGPEGRLKLLGETPFGQDRRDRPSDRLDRGVDADELGRPGASGLAVQPVRVPAEGELEVAHVPLGNREALRPGLWSFRG